MKHRQNKNGSRLRSQIEHWWCFPSYSNLVLYAHNRCFGVKGAIFWIVICDMYPVRYWDGRCRRGTSERVPLLLVYPWWRERHWAPPGQALQENPEPEQFLSQQLVWVQVVASQRTLHRHCEHSCIFHPCLNRTAHNQHFICSFCIQSRA